MKKLSIIGVVFLVLFSACNHPVYHPHKALLTVSVAEGYDRPVYKIYWDTVTLNLTPSQETSIHIGDSAWASLKAIDISGGDKGLVFLLDTSGYEKVVRLD